MRVTQEFVQSFLYRKLEIIENTIEEIKGATDILVNSEEWTNEEIESSLEENYGGKFHTASIVKEWNEYGRITYLRMQISKNSEYTSVSMLNATIFVHNFLEKFLK